MFRLVITIIFFLLSLMCILPAPEAHLWYLSIIITEFPWIFILISLLLLLWGLKVKKRRRAGAIVGWFALVLFLYPVLNAYYISFSLEKKLETAFGKGNIQLNHHEAPFSFWRMFTGLGMKEIPHDTKVYGFYYSFPVDPLRLDYYRSPLGGVRPCVVVVHGGSWAGGDSRQLPELNTYLAKAGYNVASINYHLAPRYKYPEPTDNVQNALSYLKIMSGQLGIDTNRFVLLGRSAGGQIVLDAAYKLHDPCIKGVIDIYGPSNMAYGYQHPANPLVLDTRKIMTDYLGGTLEQVPQNYAASSATENVNAHSVPTLMIHGKNDPLVPYSNGARLNEMLDSLHVPHFLLTLPWATHGCDYTLNGPSGQLSVYAIERFLKFATK